MRISDWSSDVCSSDLGALGPRGPGRAPGARLVEAARLRPGAGAGVRAHLRGHRHPLARVRAVRGPGGPGKPVQDVALPPHAHGDADHRLEENTYELQSIMRNSYADFRLQKKNKVKKI